jgi:putative ATP-dependent endonuclease of OLD family
MLIPMTLGEIGDAITKATAKIAEFDAVKELEDDISDLFKEMSGPKHDIKPKLGFTPTEAARLYRSIRLLTDDGKRSISEASLGSANILFLTLKTLELKSLIDENSRDHTFLQLRSRRLISTRICNGPCTSICSRMLAMRNFPFS